MTQDQNRLAAEVSQHYMDCIACYGIASVNPKLTVFMRITEVATHCPTVSLAALSEFNDRDLVHDVQGMLNEWDSETKSFKNFFSPRCTRRAP